jgi:hypothetical protein
MRASVMVDYAEMQVDDMLQSDLEQVDSGSASNSTIRVPSPSTSEATSHHLVHPSIRKTDGDNATSKPPHSNNLRFIAPLDLRARQHSCPDFATIMDTILAYTTQRRALKIADLLQSHFRSRNTRITGLRATEVEPFTDEAPPLSPMVEWREGNDTDMLAFFKTLDGDVPCSWLMHSGVGFRWPGPQRWNQSSIAWGVTDLGHLKELFAAAQHILGLLQWSHRDLMKLCVENSSKDCSLDEYVHCSNFEC